MIGLDGHGGAAIAVLAHRSGAQLLQPVQQISDRPLAHPLYAIQTVSPTAKGRERGQESYRCSAVGTEQLRIRRRNLATCAMHD